MTPAEDFLMAAFAIRQHHPALWDRFMAGLLRYRTLVQDQCVQSTLEELQRAQGRAQAVAAVYELLLHAPDKAPAIQAR